MCDLIIRTEDGRYFEWDMTICANSFADAVQKAEGQVSQWNKTARLEEIEIRHLVHAKPTPFGPEIFIPAWPREMVPQQSPESLRAQKESRP